MVASASFELQYIMPELLLECLDARIQSLVYSRLEDPGNHLLLIYSCGEEQRYQVREIGPARVCTALDLAVKSAPPGYCARYVVRCFSAPAGCLPASVQAAPSVPYALSRVVLLADNPADSVSSTRLPFAEAEKKPSVARQEIRPQPKQPITMPPVVKKAAPPAAAAPVAASAPAADPASTAAATPASVVPVAAASGGAPVASARLSQGIQDFRKALESRETELRTREKAVEAGAAGLAAREAALAESAARALAAASALAAGEAELEAARRVVLDKQGLLAAAERDLLARQAACEARQAACDAREAELGAREAADAAVERSLVERNEALEKEVAALLALLQEFSGESVQA